MAAFIFDVRRSIPLSGRVAGRARLHGRNAVLVQRHVEVVVVLDD